MKLKNVINDLSKQNKFFIVSFSFLFVLVIIYFTRETLYSLEYLLYIPVFLASALFQIYGGLIGGFITGIILTILSSDSENFQTQAFSSLSLEFIMPLGFGYMTGKISKCTNKYTHTMEKTAYYDGTTGLPNQIILNDIIDYMIVEEKNDFAIVIVSIENIFDIFNIVGYSKSNEVLNVIANLFRGYSEDKNVLIFRSDYNFKFLLKKFSELNSHKWLSKFKYYIEKNPINIESISIYLKIDLGAALYNNSISSSDDIIKNAFTALDYSRANFTGFEIYNPKMEKFFNFTTLVSEFKTSLNNEDFYLEYQPKLNLKDGKVYGVEALIRWNHPKLGLIPPLNFIPQLEKTNYINDLTYWIVVTVINDIREWKKSGLNLKVSINLTPKNILDKEFMQKINANIKINMPFTKNLEFELTETDLMTKLDTIKDALIDFKRDGIKIYIDDFGTGYSSLAYLKKLPIDSIKIDRIFIKELVRDTLDKEIVNTTIKLAHALGKVVVAEGVEDIETLNLLKKMNCDEIQGYYYARPMKKKDLELFLKKELIR